jgi:alpha-L-arabinofuranosidase
VLTAPATCAGGDTAYTTATGLAMAQFAGLTGSRIATAVRGGPALVSLPASIQPGMSIPALSAVASTAGGVTTVVIVNASPQSSVPVQLNLSSGATPVSATGTAVGGDPYAANTDAAPATVTPAPLAPAIAGSSLSVTVPAFSVSTITIHMS